MRSCTTALLILMAVSSAFAWQTGNTPYTEGRLLLRFDSAVKTVEDAKLLLSNPDLIPTQLLVSSLDIWMIDLPKNLSVEQALADLEGQYGIRWAQADHILKQRQTFPNDPQWGSQWDMHNTGQSGGTVDADIDAPEAWDYGTGGTDGNGNDIVVAIVDGGMELTHDNLQPNLWVNQAEANGTAGVDDDNNGYVDDINGWDGYANDGSIPVDGHGTHVAGTVGARGNDGSKVCGINWNVKLMAVAASSGATSVISVGYGYVLDQKTLWLQSGGTQGANVVSTNSSFGVDLADCTSGSYPVWNDLYDAMGGVGILSAAATANANYNIDTQGDVPTSCSSDWMISVTNTTRSDVKNSSAGYGSTTIDLGAPGTSVLSTYTGNGTNTLTGTSMATPHVAGAVAFLHSVAGPGFTAAYAADPAAGALTLKQIMLDTVDPLASLQGTTVSGGRLNLAAAAASISQIGGSLLSGIVSAASDGQPVESAMVVAQPGDFSTQTNALGEYVLALQPGNYSVTASAFGYADLVLPAALPDENPLTLDFDLNAGNVAEFSGIVRDVNDMPLAGAEVEIPGVPLAPQVTGPDGAFSFMLPVGDTFTVISRTAPGEIHDPQAMDAYGYRAYDAGDTDWSQQQFEMLPTGVTMDLKGSNRVSYNWTTIDPDQGGAGTALQFTSDDETLPLSLPFDFMFYGQSFNSLSICGNGWLAFGTTAATEYRGQAIPTAAEPNAVLAPFWEDLSPQQAVSGNVSHYYDMANGRFIIEFYDIRQFSPATDLERFQVILLDPAQHTTVTGDGAILFQYANVGETDNATVGIENPAGDTGLQYYYGRSDGVGNPGGALPATNPAISDGLALLFTTGMLTSTPGLEAVTDLGITYGAGMVHLSWSAAAGAASYSIEARNIPSPTWNTVTTVTSPLWQEPSISGTRLYRVIAQN